MAQVMFQQPDHLTSQSQLRLRQQQQGQKQERQKPPLQLNDEDKNDPKIVDELLSKELLQLSVNDRNGIQEEIHGVGCLAPEETDELISSSLKQLSTELENLVLPSEGKRAYLKSQSFEATYVNDKAFRLRFLRCELFDVYKTALRICEFLELVLELFGEYALWRPIRLTDFTKEELKDYRKGRYQFLPYRDRSGRRIITIFPGEELENISGATKAKIALYTSWAAGSGDIDVQRKGVIFVAWFDKSFKISQKPQKLRAKDHQVASVRASAIHCCTPDTPFYRFRRSIMTMRIASHNRYKLKVHLGESIENRYTLQTYGIPSERIPLTWSGSVKLTYLRQWMRLRQLIEEAPMLTGNTLIECPNLNDVLFRQGTSTTSHPGNVTFRGMIERRLRELEQEQNEENLALSNAVGSKGKKKSNAAANKANKVVKTRQLVHDIIQEIKEQRSGRVLFWNEGGWWDEATDSEQIYLKVEYIVREFRLNLKRKTKKLAAMKEGNKAAQARRKARAHPEPSLSMLTMTQQQQQQEVPVIKLKSGTSIFLESQANGPLSCNGRSHKRPRIDNQFSSDDDDDGGMMVRPACVAECFGMKFNAC